MLANARSDAGRKAEAKLAMIERYARALCELSEFGDVVGLLPAYGRVVLHTRLAGIDVKALAEPENVQEVA